MNGLQEVIDKGPHGGHQQIGHDGPGNQVGVTSSCKKMWRRMAVMMTAMNTAAQSPPAISTHWRQRRI